MTRLNGLLFVAKLVSGPENRAGHIKRNIEREGRTQMLTSSVRLATMMSQIFSVPQSDKEHIAILEDEVNVLTRFCDRDLPTGPRSEPCPIFDGDGASSLPA